MNVYVAGKTQAIQEVRQVQALVRHTGHTITHDWTAIIEQNGGDSNEVAIPKEQRSEYAISDLQGVYQCNLLIAIGHPHLSGTIWECGAAAILSKPIWLLRWEVYGRVSIFEDLPNVEHVDIHTVAEWLWERSPKRLEMEPARMRLDELL